MVCCRSQNYTNMMIGKHGIQAFEVAVVMSLLLLLSLDVLIPMCIFLIIFGQVIYPNILKCQLLLIVCISRLFTKG